MSNFKNKTIGGSDVRFYEMNAGGEYPIHGAIKRKRSDFWEAASWTQSGRLMSFRKGNFDLIKEEDTHGLPRK
jgi:hypothetical protein